MILNQKLDYNKINIKIKQDFTNGYTFVPIKYDNKDIVIQTPKLFIPFNISCFNYKKYIDLSFQNIKNDKNVKLLYDNLELFLKKIKKNKKKYIIINFLKEFNNNFLLRLKILNNTLFFDQNKKQIKTIESCTYGSFIIHLNGIWIIDNKISFNWILLQGKIDMPLYLNEYAFIDEDEYHYKGKGKGKGKVKPPPPPPIDNFNRLLKLGISEAAINHKMKMEKQIINPKDLQSIKLKKTIITQKVETSQDKLLKELKEKINNRIN